MKHSLYIFFLFVLPFLSVAGNNDKEKPQLKLVSGKVITEGGEPIAAVKIVIKETNEVFFADLSGTFKCQLKNDKPYTVSVQSVGYEPIEIRSNDLHLFSEIILKEL